MKAEEDEEIEPRIAGDVLPKGDRWQKLFEGEGEEVEEAKEVEEKELDGWRVGRLIATSNRDGRSNRNRQLRLENLFSFRLRHLGPLLNWGVLRLELRLGVKGSEGWAAVHFGTVCPARAGKRFGSPGNVGCAAPIEKSPQALYHRVIRKSREI